MFFPKLDKQSLTDGIVIPQMVKVHQAFPHKDLADPVGTLKQQLLALDEKTTASSYSTKLNRIHTSNINTNQVC